MENQEVTGAPGANQKASTLEYGELLGATYDLHRITLYQALSWPLPLNPADKFEKGKILTKYLLRGSRADKPMFTNNQGQT